MGEKEFKRMLRINSENFNKSIENIEKADKKFNEKMRKILSLL